MDDRTWNVRSVQGLPELRLPRIMVVKELVYANSLGYSFSLDVESFVYDLCDVCLLLYMAHPRTTDRRIVILTNRHPTAPVPRIT